MLTSTQVETLGRERAVAPTDVAALQDPARRAALRLVCEDGALAALREDQAEQVRRLAHREVDVDAAWLRVFPERVAFVSHRGGQLPLVHGAAEAAPEMTPEAAPGGAPEAEAGVERSVVYGVPVGADAGAGVPATGVVVAESVHLVLDRSGSMRTVGNAPFEGAREFIEQLPDDAAVATTTFASQVVRGERRLKAEALAALDVGEAAGLTCLYDAISVAVDAEFAAPAARATLLVVTDGYDTASVRTVRSARDAIARFQARDGWRVLFLASQQDAQASARTLGIPPERALSFGGEEQHVRRVMRVASESAAAFRQGRADGFSSAQRQRAM